MLDRYRTNYAGDKMGRLDFTDIVITLLSADAAYVTGRYCVETETTLSEGLFTLIFRHTSEGWKIVHDHTSSASQQ
jgi:ketosteroid isomerase-like protein